MSHMRDDDAFAAVEHFFVSLISNIRTWLTSLWMLEILDSSLQDLQRLYGGLRSLRKALTNKQKLSSLSIKIKEDLGLAVFDAGFFICSLHHTTEAKVDVGLLKRLYDTVNCIQGDVAANEPNVQVLNASKISPADKNLEVEVKRMPSLGASSSTNEVVGFNKDEKVLVDQLTGGGRFQIVAIVGMPGLGKTTLATEVYNNRCHCVLLHFHVRAWCHVSQMVDIKKELLDLLNQIDPSSRCSRWSTEHDLADTLRKSLLGRRYLIFLDDVWNIKAWNMLSASFPKDSPNNHGSRIILTSRRHDVAPRNLLVNQKPYFLLQLNEEESLNILQRECAFEFSVDLGVKVAEKCRGLPLMIVIVAGFLKHVDPEGWDELLDHLSSESIMEQCRNTLELSYRQLPDYLKPCLLYFGTFLENQEISVRRLLQLWTAEEIIQGDDMSSLKEYLNDLISRRLVLVAKQTSPGGVKTCQIHDLIRHFCVQKAKEEHLFYLVRGYDELSAFNGPRDLQRLCLHLEAEHFDLLELFCPRARSLILNSSESTHTLIDGIEWRCISRVFRIFKHLKVLDLDQVNFGFRFPREIQQFVQLTFLANLCEANIPEWIGDLSDLETLIKLGNSFRLPDNLWILQKLRYL